MARYQTADGRWMVGDVEGQSNYNGFNGWRDCVIQLTASGATDQSVKYLEAFRDYALAHNALGESIMPPSVNVWISNNGTTTAVQADDLSVSGNTFTIGGIKWTGSAWDYTNAGQSSGGGGGSGGGGALVTVMNDDTGALDKTLSEIITAMPLVYIAFVKNEEAGTVTKYQYYPVSGYMVRTNGYGEVFVTIEGKTGTFAAYSLDDYPVISQN